MLLRSGKWHKWFDMETLLILIGLVIANAIIITIIIIPCCIISGETDRRFEDEQRKRKSDMQSHGGKYDTTNKNQGS
jgi:hypothetical protein